ncbi:MAG: DnaA regulatory inactivator Hda [gamma proteobacterium symbiont of Lucinoma myriamae]|nr:DnaA regulatory inactivator Hda [gamma proteobacterium symbiont of Lucinoma myriamae]MCU7819210.1 DnaA regulatory inactivator Hda [gamma proteobacterium symbiont of Lucinoma myriamae]
MKNQLPLSLQAAEHASFDNFIAGENQQLIFSLLNENEQLIVVWGDEGTGKTHLLQALSSQYQANGLNALYIPLQIDDDFSPELLGGLEMMDLVCLDDIHTISGHQEWEMALFHFFNKIRENNGRLILAANNSALNLDIQLPDLKSRLSWGLTYQTQKLSDKDKINLLKLRAHKRGFEMTDEVANYLLKHAARELSALIKLLEKLDYESLAKQRKLTIPFIKSFL